jgi:16S rRNA (guanine527-N7)-methyltransferase
MSENEFIEEIKLLSIDITNDMLKKLSIYYEYLLEWNDKINLTSITNKEEVYLKHFYDSLTLIKAIDLNKEISVCDIGTGAGFPGLVLKIVFPKINITLVDSTRKRTMFLQQLIKKLDINNCNVVTARAEDFIKENREKYDLITCRAVSKLSIISELCIPGVKVNGYFIPMKANIEEELKNIDILKKLNSEIEKIIKFNLPKEGSIRNLIVIKKNDKTNNIYPREYNKILKG